MVVRSRTKAASSWRQAIILPGIEAGGGGFGDPRERDRSALAADIREGYVTTAGAVQDYGIALEGTME
jgi:N-methylhydantoinase B/oxoprolinase/acetone carboxylase alpha subunit